MKEEIKIIHLEGGPYERGYRHGKILAKEIHWLEENLGKIFARYEGILGRVIIPLFKAVSTVLEKNIPEEFREEMRGVADGAKVSYCFICLINLVEELGEIFYSLKPSFCSCFVARDREGNIIWGRNLDYLFYEVLSDFNVVFVYYPKNGYPFISLGWPGIVGVLTGISPRFDLIVLSSPAKAKVFNAIPQDIANRQTIQYASNLKEGVKKIVSIPATIGRNLVFVSKDEAKVIEISPKKSALRTFEDGYITVTNHYQIKEMEKEQGKFYGTKSVPEDFHHLAMTKEGSIERNETMKKLLKLKESIDVEEAKLILNSVAHIGTIQKVIAIPQKEEFWMANNKKWIHFSIRDLLVGGLIKV